VALERGADEECPRAGYWLRFGISVWKMVMTLKTGFFTSKTEVKKTLSLFSGETPQTFWKTPLCCFHHEVSAAKSQSGEQWWWHSHVHTSGEVLPPRVIPYSPAWLTRRRECSGGVCGRLRGTLDPRVPGQETELGLDSSLTTFLAGCRQASH
jgi:hypothetical protein